MILMPGSDRIIADDRTNPVLGRVRWAPAKSLWIGTMTVLAVALGPPVFTWDAFALFVITSGITLCFGHSVGMHRKLIHQSFECPLWLERICVYLGTLVGMAGPFGMIRLHDFRDWAQRQPACHDYSCHRASFFRDAWWQMHCRLALKHPPEFRLEPRLANDRFYALRRAHAGWRSRCRWRLLFYAIGGWPFVIWGVCVRVAVCVTGHWLIGHYAHRKRRPDLGDRRRLRARLQRAARRASSAWARLGTTIITPIRIRPRWDCCRARSISAGG